MGATVLRPGPLVMPRIEWKFLAVTDRPKPIRGHAERNQVGLRGEGPLFAEREVVFGRAALVAVPLDGDDPRGVLLQDAGVRIERLLTGAVDFEAVQRVENRLERGILVDGVQVAGRQRVVRDLR